MRTKLLATVAVVALIGGTSVTLAQQDEHGGPAGKPSAGQERTVAPGGPTGQAQPGGAMQHGTPGGSAQNQTPEKKGEPKGVSQTEPGKPGMKTDEHAQTPGGKNEEHAQTPAGGKTEENAQTQRNGQPQQNAGETKAPAGKSVQLSETQRTQIKSVIVRDHNFARVDNVNFNISVGVRVPRDVHYVVLPADVVTIVPEYSGFDYIVVGDQLLIIDPNTLEIVAILPA